MKLHLIALLIFCSIASSLNASVALASVRRIAPRIFARIGAQAFNTRAFTSNVTTTKVADTDQNLVNTNISNIFSDRARLAKNMAITARTNANNAEQKVLLADYEFVAAKHAYEIARTNVESANTHYIFCVDVAERAERLHTDIERLHIMSKNAQCNDILGDPANDKIPE